MQEKRGQLYNPFYRLYSFKAKFLCMNMNEKTNENESTLLDSFIGNFLWWVTSLLFGLSSSAKTSLTYYALTYLVLGLIVEIP